MTAVSGDERISLAGRNGSVSETLASAGVGLTASTLTDGRTTYEEAVAGTNVTILVTGEPLNPERYRLAEGDAVEILAYKES